MITNAVLNPGAEGATSSLENSTGSTVSIVTTTGTGWPARGTKSYSVVAGAATIATARLRLVERAAATAGKRWHTRAKLRAFSGNTGTRRYLVELVSYTAAPGSTAGTATVIGSATYDLAPGAIVDVAVSGINPSGGLSVGLQISRTVVTNPATGDGFHVDDLMLAQVDDAATPEFVQGGLPGMFWTGAANASTSIKPNTVPALVIDPGTETTQPNVQVTFSELYPDTRTLTLYRSYGGLLLPVREAENAFAVGAFTVTDYEVPLRSEFRYVAMQRNAAGGDLGYTDYSVPTFVASDPDYAWLSDPLRPRVFVRVEMTENAGQKPSNPIPAQLHRIGDRVVALVGSRSGLKNVNMDFFTDTTADREAVDDLLGAANGLVLMRTPPPMMVPRLLYCFAGNAVPDEFTALSLGDETIEWANEVDELPPFQGGYGEPVATWQTYIDTYPTWAAAQAAYATWLAAQKNPPVSAG